MATETLDPAQAFITKIANRLKPVQEITARGTSNVQQFYCGATVFVTGGSGFLGKHLIEKLFSLIKNWPNTYTYTKAVAESLVEAMGKDLPICVVRPAIVVTTIREPTPGWLDISCIYGATGVSFKCLSYMLDDVMSTDARNYATPKAIGYGFVWSTYNRLLFRLYAWLLHLIPAYIIDVVVTLFGHKRRYAKLAQKLIKMCDVLAYFLTHGWKFEDQNTASLYDKLSEDDKKIFNFDVTNIDWTEYILTWCVGLRKYIIKDGLTDTLYARKKQTLLKIATYTNYYLYTSMVLFFFWLYGSPDGRQSVLTPADVDLQVHCQPLEVSNL
ncbi:hypothetical protein HF086_005714 [Spodoptera exigua]|uniref:Fatty acyl-CoA reductase n=1 Tax=Spodoptera exigua TaxID=7107 RepID=A0A922SR81_SPOEX|nr:hypothetical protein HF086_005714 [Spodoptera exigua]